MEAPDGYENKFSNSLIFCAGDESIQIDGDIDSAPAGQHLGLGLSAFTPNGCPNRPQQVLVRMQFDQKGIYPSTQSMFAMFVLPARCQHDDGHAVDRLRHWDIKYSRASMT